MFDEVFEKDGGLHIPLDDKPAGEEEAVGIGLVEKEL